MQTKRDRFTNWRKTTASAEESYIATALKIDDHVKTIQSVQQLKQDLSSKDSPTYLEFSQFKQPLFGVLLFVKLEVEEALDKENIKEDRKTILKRANDLLTQLYKAPSLSDIQRLIEEANVFFKNKAPNAPEEQILCFAFSTLLCIFPIWYDNLPSWKAAPLSLGADIPQLKKQINELLTTIESQSNALPLDLSAQKPLKEQLVDTLTLKTTTELPTELKRMDDTLSKLIAAKEELEKLQTNKQDVTNLHTAIITNENKSWFYQTNLTQLIKAHPNALQLVRGASSDDQPTADVKELSQTYLNNLKQQENNLKIQIQELRRQLTPSSENPDSESIEMLKAIQVSVRRAQNTLPKLSTLTKNNVQMLQNFINQHDGIFVKISNFFAQWLPFFKSNTATLIEEAERLQKDLADFETLCLQRVTHLKSNIDDKFNTYQSTSPGLKELDTENLPSFIKTLRANIEHFKEKTPRPSPPEPLEEKSPDSSSASLHFFAEQTVDSNPPLTTDHQPPPKMWGPEWEL